MRSATATATRVYLEDDPFLARTLRQPYWEKGNWRCHWIGLEGGMPKPCVMAFRREFTLAAARTIRLHISADERYCLYLDGKRIARGSERGSPHRWFFETYDLTLKAGAHTLAAIVWALGDMPPGLPGQNPQHLGSSVYGALAPTAQMSTYPGFLCAPDKGADEKLLGTGVAPWEAKRLPGYAFVQFHLGAQLTGAKLDVDGRTFAWGAEAGRGKHWQPAQTLHPGVDGLRSNDRAVFHKLFPATLPPMLSKPVHGITVAHAGTVSAPDARGVPVTAKNHVPAQAAEWTGLLAGKALTIPAHSARRVILNLNEYYCAYNGVTVSGGAQSTVRLHWAESLFDDAPPKAAKGEVLDLTRWCPRWKGQRDAFEGKFFVGMGDLFRPDGGARRHFESLWWHAGRYLELFVTTGAEPLTLHRLDLEETRYPFEPEAKFSSSDGSLSAITPMLNRVMQACMHETYVDCPYYEQLMYVGDTRVEVLTTYALTADDRLPKKAIDTFDASRLPSGLTQSRFPCSVQQVIPPFSLWWVVMVRDYLMWRDDRAFVQRMLPGVRGVIAHFIGCWRDDFLVVGPNGWNFMDWVPGWENGIPPDGEYGASGVINWLAVLAFQAAEEIGKAQGDTQLEQSGRTAAVCTIGALVHQFFDARRGLFADDLAHTQFSEHSQCMALLSGLAHFPQEHAQVKRNLFRDTELKRGTVYFMHYLFEACRLCDRMDVFFKRLQFWHDQKKQGFITSVECPEPSRSDCHAWGAHPLFHYRATILGVRPAAPTFAEVAIQPHLGALTEARGTVPHPRGEIRVELARKGGRLTGLVDLPAHTTGSFVHGRHTIRLKTGRQKITLEE